MNRFWLVLLGAVTLGRYPQAVEMPADPTTTSFQFRDPQAVRYFVTTPSALRLTTLGQDEWLTARPANGSTNTVQLGSRVVLRLEPGVRLESLLAGRSATVSRRVTGEMVILQTSDAWAAALLAQDLATLPGVVTAHPVRRKTVKLMGQYAAKPNDPRFPGQWHLENRDTNGVRQGIDLNARGAWPFTRGENVIVAVVDDGVELSHPDLTNNAVSDLHTNFISNGQPNGMHAAFSQYHGTPVAGLIAAQGGNGIGVSGVAPAARFASWVIFDRFDNLPDEEGMMDMFQYRSNVVSVQNHSWGNSTIEYLAVSDLETAGISNAVQFGRSGKGVVMVRAAGNLRVGGGDANFDGYASDPQAIAVGAVRSDGRATEYSNPGACVLVAAPSAESTNDGTALDFDFPTIYSTDRLGSAGLNSSVTSTDDADYCFGSTGFSGTSASSPEVAGVAALILSANPILSYRDVQEILLLSARQSDPGDLSVQINGAGLIVGHNSGYGVPDAGVAVQLARKWQPRPAATNISLTVTNELALVDDALRVEIQGQNVPTNLVSALAFPDDGVQAETITASLPLVNIGLATNDILFNLTGKAALIQRGENFFFEKIEHAARAGAAFAIIYNNVDADARIVMVGNSRVAIPAVFISQNDGEALAAALAADTNLTARLHPLSATYSFAITNTLSCEHIAVTVNGEHDNFGDLRIVLVSPTGTRSVMQPSTTTAPISFTGWTFYSVQHFFESSAGVWNVYITDENPGGTGVIHSVTLGITGVPITDADHDGLDDSWELAHFGNLTQGPQGDPDGDGHSNLREMLLGSDPLVDDIPFVVDLAPLDTGLLRLSWPGRTNWTYDVLGSSTATAPPAIVATLPGKFPEMEWIAPFTNGPLNFFHIRAKSVVP